MKLPFFRSSRSASSEKQLITVPPIPARPAKTSNLAKTTRIELDPQTDLPRANTTPSSTGRDTTPANTQRIPLAVSSIVSQLPTNIFVEGAHNLLANTTINIPLDRVLPQLATGKISMPLGEIVPLLPTALVQPNRPLHHAQQAVILPIADIVAAIPSTHLNTQPEQTVEIDSEEFDNIPGLFDTQQINQLEPPRPIVPPQSLLDDDAPIFVEQKNDSTPPTTPEPIAVAAAPRPEPVSIAPAPQPIVVPSQPVPVPVTPVEPVAVPVSTTPIVDHTDITAEVFVSLRSIVAVMPDRIFAVPRANLWQQADPAEKIPLPVAAIVPQLKTGRITLPLIAIVKTIPPSLLVSPLPPINNETVPLPLDEIIPQLPPSAFVLDKVEYNEAADLEDTDIPIPFEEKTLPQPVSQTEEPTLIAPTPEPLAIQDDTFAVFTEKTTPPAAPQPEPLAVAPVPEPVAITPTPQPIADTLPVPALVASVQPVESNQTPAPVQPAVSAEPVAPTASPDEPKFAIDINHCTVADLTRINGIGLATAKRIIEYRAAHGRIESLDELRQIPGIGRKTFRLLTGTQPRKINRLLGVEHNNELSLQEIVRLTNNLPGIQGCILALDDGMFLTGQLPAHFDVNTVSVFAPQLFRKVGRYTRELGVGHIQRFTIFTDQQPLTIFQAGSVYLIIIHDSKRYSKVLLLRCERISKEIARLTSQRATV